MKKRKALNIIHICIALLGLAIIVCYFVPSIEFINEKMLLVGIAFASEAVGYLIFVMGSAKSQKKIELLEQRVSLTNSLAYRIKNAGEKCFTEIPIGIIVYANDLKVEWANTKAKQIFNSSLVDRKLNNLYSGNYDNKDFETKIRNLSDFQMDIYGRHYEVKVLRDNNVIYLIDKSDYKELEYLHYISTQAAGILNLDNYEEAIADYDIQERALITSDIISILSTFCEENGVYLRAYSDKQFLILTSRENLLKIMNDNFKILEQVNNYCSREHVKLTLSIGIACMEKPIVNIMEKAGELLDLALNRGGNQVVVQVDENLEYFGGKEKGVDAKLPVFVRVKAEDLYELIKESKNVLVMSHKQTDADAFGASIATYKFAKAVGRPCKIVIDEDDLDPTVSQLYKLIEAEHIGMIDYFISPSKALSTITEDTLLIIVDAQADYLLISNAIYQKVKKIAIIDHHRSNNNAISRTNYLYNKTSASSSVELIVEMYDYIDEEVEISATEASMMLLGIVVDTNQLIYRTNAQTFAVLSKLQSYGAEMTMVQKFLREEKDIISKRGDFIANMETVCERFGIAICDDEIYSRQFIAKIADSILTINYIDAGFCIGYIDKNHVAISARSLDDVNVQRIMEDLGGGGHFNNSATQIANVSIEEAKIKLINRLKSMEKSGENNMKVILKKEVKGKGKPGDIIEVPAGYGSFLIKSNVALLASVDNINELERKNEQDKIDAQNLLEEMKELKIKIEENPITIEMRVGKEGKLFGSVSSKQIVDEYKAKYNITLDKRKIIFDDKQIDSLGTYQIAIQLHKEVKATMKIYVVEKKG